MKIMMFLMSIAFAGLLVGCAASVPPPELVSARQAYQQASTGQAAQLVPAELQKAQEALAVAEKAFQEEPKSFRTRDLALEADRKAKMAEELATTVTGKAGQTVIVRKSARQLAMEDRARVDAETKMAEAEANLVQLAAVKEEARGLVITLSGSVLFASNKSELLPAAQNRLKWVADALLATKERRLTIEAHTDAQGSSSHNLKLSQDCAESVRSFIISRGYPGELIRAQGMGEDKPIAGNSNAEERANNRRVEIIVDRQASSLGNLIR